jgi:purine-binding chemotaxis protein CheW
LASTHPAPDARLAPGDDAATAHRYLLFTVGERLYGCEIGVVREIVPFRRCTRLPGAPGYVCGLINMRGTVVTVLDLGLRLGGAAVDRNEGSVILVEHGARVVALGVDGMRDVQRIPPAAIAVSHEAPHAAAVGNAGLAVRGVAHAAGGVVVLLDVGSIIRQALV